jgi:hypothetical protein
MATFVDRALFREALDPWAWQCAELNPQRNLFEVGRRQPACGFAHGVEKGDVVNQVIRVVMGHLERQATSSSHHDMGTACSFAIASTCRFP